MGPSDTSRLAHMESAELVDRSGDPLRENRVGADVRSASAFFCQPPLLTTSVSQQSSGKHTQSPHKKSARLCNQTPREGTICKIFGKNGCLYLGCSLYSVLSLLILSKDLTA